MSNIVSAGSNAVVAPIKMRFRCVVCTTEVGMQDGSYEDALRLLEASGWRLGASMVCPRCMRDKARKIKRTFFDERYE